MDSCNLCIITVGPLNKGHFGRGGGGGGGGVSTICPLKYSHGATTSVLCREVVPISEGPSSEVPLYTQIDCINVSPQTQHTNTSDNKHTDSAVLYVLRVKTTDCCQPATSFFVLLSPPQTASSVRKTEMRRRRMRMRRRICVVILFA